MSNYLLIGSANANVDFGTAGVAYTACGTVVSGGEDLGGDKVELKDVYGNVNAVIYFNDKNECTVDIMFDTTTTPPIRGDVLSIMGLTNVLVDGVGKKWEQGKEMILTIKATKYAGVTPAS